jgi:hypothetical protein
VYADEATTLRVFARFRGHTLEGDELATARDQIAREGRVILRITPEEFFPH